VERRSFLCKVRIEGRIRSSPSAVPPSVPSRAFSLRPAEVSPALFHSATSTFARRPSPAFERRSSSRVLESKAADISRLSVTKFPRPCIKRRIERASGARRDQGEEARCRGRGGGEQRRTDARNHSAPFKRGEPPPRAASPPRLWDAMMRLFRPPLPSGSDVTSRCNKHEYK